MSMRGDYPTEDELTMVRNWAFTKPGDFEAFMAYVQSVGMYWPTKSFGWRQQGRTFWIATGGWSGNEDILEAMQENFIFWSVCWQQTKRGGQYQFTLPDPRTYFMPEPANPASQE